MDDVAADYRFEGGFPAPSTVQQAYADADLSRAVEAYRFFFPTVSSAAIWEGMRAVGVVPNSVFGVMDTRPDQMGLTLNSDTPYGPLLLDLHGGPMVIELPPGPLMCAVMDMHQGWLADMGLPGPDAGEGGRYLVVPPSWGGEPPSGHHLVRSTTYRVIGGVRAIPVKGDLDAAHELMRRIHVAPLYPTPGAPEPTWPDLTAPQDTTPGRWETSLEFWRTLHEVLGSEPDLPEHTVALGLLAALGIVRGEPFEPDAASAALLERAARVAGDQMRVQAFADRRPDRVVWPETQWEWPALRYENGLFRTAGYLDVVAREKWFFQAIAASPAMFRRDAEAGSLYWLGLRDDQGAFLDGGGTYTLTVPQPVPGRLFWSVTVYDAHTRSQIRTEQNVAALRSLFELADTVEVGSLALHFGPHEPAAPDARTAWIQTVPGRGWFVYFRIYGPEPRAFDGTWRLPDLRRHG